MSCKRVCKAWRDLLETPEFVNSHHSKSVPGLVARLGMEYTEHYEVFEFVDELNPMQCVRHLNRIFVLNLPRWKLHSSVNGLFFLWTGRWTCLFELPRDFFISNPITREYIKLPFPPEYSSIAQVINDTFGFGLSKITGQYKVVRIFRELIVEEGLVWRTPFKCQVYTVGTGPWRRISSAGLFNSKGSAKGAFVNGNLHWVVHDLKGSSVWISCLDLETELFSAFSPPPCHREENLSVSSLKDCLCYCDNSARDEIVIWLMKEYGVEKSWTKEFVISKHVFPYIGRIWPIKAFNNGDVLLEMELYGLVCFSGRAMTICDANMFGLKSRRGLHVLTYTPSFVPLRNYARETVISF